MKISKKILSLLLCAVMVLSSALFTELGILDYLSVKVCALSPTYNVSNSFKNSQYYSSLCNVNLTGNQRDDIISVALSQKGYYEGSYDGDFGGANDGAYNNYCEYNYWYHNNVSTGMPVGGSELAPWCATFVSWCARQAGIPTSVLQNSTAAGHGKSYFNINYAAGGSQKKDGDEARFLGNYYTPQKGDLFYTSGWTHVGLVVSVNEAQGKITTIEGNTNTSGSSNGDGVYSRTRNISDCYFGIPNYTGNAPVTKEVDPNYSKNFLATANGKYYTLTSSYSQESNRYVEPGDACTIYEVYTDGYCFFNYPISGGSRDAYGRIEWFDVVPVLPAPSNPWVSLPNGPESTYKLNEEFYISFGADNATSYSIDIWKGTETGSGHYWNGYVTSSSGSYNYPVSFDKTGHYSCVVTCYNSSGEVCSNWIGWDIVDSVPSDLSISLANGNKQNFSIGSQINFKLSAKFGYYKHIGIHKFVGNETVLYAESDVAGSDCSIAIDSPGLYRANFDAFNACGTTRSDWVYFSVGLPPTNVTLSTNKNEYKTGEIVYFKAESNNANGYTIGIDKLNNTTGKYSRLFTQDIASDFTYEINYDGIYRAYVTAWNDTGMADSSKITFYVGCYDVCFDSNGGDEFNYILSVPYGSSKNIITNKPTRTGYTFIGWNTAKDGSGTSYASGAVYSANSAVTLYAQWQANTYIAAFNANGGTTPTESKSVTYGSTYGTLPIPERVGYNFDGWFTDEMGGTEITESSVVTISDNQTLFAHWSPIIHTVSFVADNVIVYTQEYSAEQTEIDFPDVPKVPYKLNGRWQKSDSEGVNIEYYAVYESPTAMAPAQRTLNAGNSARIIVSSNYTVESRIWSSDNSSVATVDSHGNVTAISEGECYITAVNYGKDDFGNDISAEAKIKIIVAENDSGTQTAKEKFESKLISFIRDLLENLKVIFRYLAPFIKTE